MKKYSNKKSLPIKLATGALAVILATSAAPALTAKQYENANITFDYDSVSNRTDYWGGDQRYLDQNYNMFQFRDSALATHFENKNRAIVVGYSDNCTENEIEQFNYVIAYYNKLFSTINNNYRFVTKVSLENECDIYIDSCPLPEKTGATVQREYGTLNSCKVTGANIKVNNATNSTNAELRFYLAHEFMHILYGSSDINEAESSTISLYNYSDVGFMVHVINNRTPQEYRDSFISLMPTDVATLISIYGDPYSAEKHNEYVDLLNETLDNCCKVFGSFQPYFEKDFTMPQKFELEKTKSLSK